MLDMASIDFSSASRSFSRLSVATLILDSVSLGLALLSKVFSRSSLPAFLIAQRVSLPVGILDFYLIAVEVANRAQRATSFIIKNIFK